MKYFTPDLYVRLQNLDQTAMDAADADWEAAEQQYEQHLQRLGPAIAPLLQKFDGVLLHDAVVLSITQRQDHFIMVLRKDIPPQDVVTLTYTLASPASIDQNAFGPAWQSRLMQFEYDELDVDQEGGQMAYTHSMLFSNGWEIRLRFHDVNVAFAQPIYPLPRTTQTAATSITP